MLEKVRKTVRNYQLLVKGDKVVAAVSGGPDSVCLLKVLTLLADEYRLELLIAHLNHGMRGEESDRDEAFVRSLGKDLDLRVETGKVDIPGLLKGGGISPEDLCRIERYRFLSEVCRQHQFTKVALGHHRNDRVETVLMNFLRGSGAEGLKGFSPSRGGIYVRPLFDLSRAEILDFLRSAGLRYAIDSTNNSEDYLRNRLRRHLIPWIEKHYNPGFSENLISMSEILASENAYMKEAAENVLRRWGIETNKREIRIGIEDLLSCHPALQKRIAMILLLKLTPSEKGIGYRHITSVLDLAGGSNPSGSLDLPFNIHVRRDYGSLVFTKTDLRGRSRAVPEGGFFYSVQIPGVLELTNLGTRLRFELTIANGSEKKPVDLRQVFMDYDKISFPLAVRNMEPGDRIRPFGMTGRKKLSDLFIDLKIPRFNRSRLPILVDREEVLWIPGIGLSEKVRTTPKTRKILKAEII